MPGPGALFGTLGGGKLDEFELMGYYLVVVLLLAPTLPVQGVSSSVVCTMMARPRAPQAAAMPDVVAQPRDMNEWHQFLGSTVMQTAKEAAYWCCHQPEHTGLVVLHRRARRWAASDRDRDWVRETSMHQHRGMPLLHRWIAA